MNRIGRIFKHKWIWITLLFLAIAAWWIWSSMLSARGTEAQGLENLQTTSLEKGEITRTLLVSGSVRSQNSRNIYAPSSLKLTEVLVKEGDVVKAGQKLAILATADLVLDIKSAELNLQNSKESLKSAGTDNKNAIATAKGSVDSAALDVRTAQRQYDDTKAQAEKNPGTAVLSARADVKTAERQLAVTRGQAEGAAGSALLSSKKDLEVAQRQYDTLLAQDQGQSGTTVVSAKKELDIAQRQYDALAAQTKGNSGNSVLSAKKDLEVAQRAYDQLVAQGNFTPTVQSAKKDLEIAERAYQESQLPVESTPTVKTAKAELTSATNKYAQLQKGKTLSEQSALNRYNSAVDALNQAQTGANSQVNQATIAWQNADREYRAAAAAYEASKTIELPAGDPTLKSAADQASANVSEKQAALTAANQAQRDNVKSAQDNVNSSNLDYRQSVESSAEALEQAKQAVDRAQISYDSALKSAADAKMNAKDTWDKAKQSFDSAWNSSREALTNAADALEKSKQAYDVALKGASESLVSAQDSLEKAKQAYDSAVSSSKESLTTARDTLDKAKQAYQNVGNTANEALAAAQESLEKSKLGYESALKNQSEAFATAASALERAKNSYESAQLNLQIAESKTEDAAQLSIELQQVSLDKLQKQLADTVITAPISGTVTFKNATVDQFAAGLMFTVEDTSKLTVSAAIGEADIGSMQVGQPAFVQTDGTGDEEFKAKLAYVGASAVKNATAGDSAAATAPVNTSVQFAANVDIDKADPRIRVGMNARMTIVLDQKNDVFSVPLDAVTTGDNGDMIYVLQNGQLQELPVTLGIQNDISVEIQSPRLSPGMTIISAAQEASDLLMASPELKGEAASND